VNILRPRRLGPTGLDVSCLGLGTNNFGMRLDETASHAVLDAALEAGINLIDTADVYGFGATERIIGSWLGVHRDEVVLATKVGMDQEVGGTRIGSSALHIRRGVDESLERLRTDRIDLLQLHIGDPWTPIDETLQALDDLVRSGKVIYVGVSNFAAWEVARAAERARSMGWPPIVSVQPEYSLLERRVEDELVPACAAYGVSLLPYRPLARGLLTGKYRADGPIPQGTRFALQPEVAERALTPDNLALVGRLTSFAADRGMSLADLAIAWLLARPQVGSVLIGASTPEQLRQNAASVQHHLDDADMAELDRILPTPPRTDLGQQALRRQRP
jgi:aryl-alcohol dehydrogenase-like predicted oxidoreductase